MPLIATVLFFERIGSSLVMVRRIRLLRANSGRKTLPGSTWNRHRSASPGIHAAPQNIGWIAAAGKSIGIEGKTELTGTVFDLERHPVVLFAGGRAVAQYISLGALAVNGGGDFSKGVIEIIAVSSAQAKPDLPRFFRWVSSISPPRPMVNE